MAESTAFPKSREANDAGYRRISGFAVAGLVVGVLFVAFLLLQVIVGLLSHSTVLMPIWLEFVAALGFGLSLIGIRSIRHSDDTLAGLRIAKAGMWISLVAGLGYGSYYGATYLAIRQQADAFTRNWFELMAKGKLNQAFLLTQPPGVGRDVNPDDEERMIIRFNAPTPGSKGSAPKAGPLDQFRFNEIVQMLRQGSADTKVTPLGVRSWERKDGAYSVKRVYGIETPEATFDVQISTWGKEAADTEKGRGWFVAFFETSVEKDSLKKTKVGQRIDSMRISGFKFLDEWGKKLLEGKIEAAFLDTLDPKDRAGVKPGDKTPFAKSNLLDFAAYKSDDRTAHAAMEIALRDLLMPTKESAMVVSAVIPRPNCAKRLWSVDSEKRVLLPLDIQMMAGPRGSNAKYFADGVAWLQSEPGQLENENTPHWRLVKIEILRASDVSEFPQAGNRISGSRFN